MLIGAGIWGMGLSFLWILASVLTESLLTECLIHWPRVLLNISRKQDTHFTKERTNGQRNASHMMDGVTQVPPAFIKCEAASCRPS